MNKHIALVKRYLVGDEVSIKELQDNSNAANVVAYAAADAASAANAAAQYAAYVSRSEGAIKPSWVQHVQSYIDRYDTRS